MRRRYGRGRRDMLQNNCTRLFILEYDIPRSQEDNLV